MVLAERNTELVRNGRRSRGPSPNGHGGVSASGGNTGSGGGGGTSATHNAGGGGGAGTPETSSDDDNSIKRNGKSKNKQSEYEEKIRVGRDYQAVCPPLIIEGERKPELLNERALLVWSPTRDIPDTKLEDYISVAKEKYGYNGEQALGMLFWHKHDLERAVMDLANFTPFPDEWTVEDKVLFEQAFQFHGKSFHRIRQMLPDKSIASLVKYYYSWKKTRHRTSAMDRHEKPTKANNNKEGSENGSENGSNEESDIDDKDHLALTSGTGFTLEHTKSAYKLIAADAKINKLSSDSIAGDVTAAAATTAAIVDTVIAIDDESMTNNPTSSIIRLQQHQQHQQQQFCSGSVGGISGSGSVSGGDSQTPPISIEIIGGRFTPINGIGGSAGTDKYGGGSSSSSSGCGGGCTNCGVACNLLITSPHGKLCASCHHHWRRTGNKRPTSGPNIGKRSRYHADSLKRKPPRGMYINHDDLVALAKSDNPDDFLDGIDRTIASLMTKTQANKQKISALKRKNSENIDDLRPPENPARINARWTNEEMLMAVEAVRTYGKDFQTIAETLGTKTEAHVRTFYVNNRRRLNLDQVLKEYEANKEAAETATAAAAAANTNAANSSVASTSPSSSSLSLSTTTTTTTTTAATTANTAATTITTTTTSSSATDANVIAAAVTTTTAAAAAAANVNNNTSNNNNNNNNNNINTKRDDVKRKEITSANLNATTNANSNIVATTAAVATAANAISTVAVVQPTTIANNNNNNNTTSTITITSTNATTNTTTNAAIVSTAASSSSSTTSSSSTVVSSGSNSKSVAIASSAITVDSDNTTSSETIASKFTLDEVKSISGGSSINNQKDNTISIELDFDGDQIEIQPTAKKLALSVNNQDFPTASDA